MKRAILFGLILCNMALVQPLWASNNEVQGYTRPDICMETNIRCILKEVNGNKYWCLKASIQRELDSRNTAQAIHKTYNNNLGNCAKVIMLKPEDKE